MVHHIFSDSLIGKTTDGRIYTGDTSSILVLRAYVSVAQLVEQLAVNQ